ncbi:hypothetical protein SAMN05518801_11823 [Novosphingobium sp. CF614]|uniref:hypothetical protein n=1 Tax=Novosphingobium sp. CF614 TaxID=1884364 RepID=UPI0008EA5906|nr:hypothetical protein [Novosphingobium sp. CF614]SFG34544.1 hypothetical protein SAMN05518801_11823 [Novosphingobium sp. CF614]
MPILRSRAAASLAVLAALAMTATPAMADGRDGWRGGRHHRHHDNGIDGGDVLAGLLVIGGIAAIASMASKSSDNSDRDEPRAEPYGYPGGPAPEDRGYGRAPAEPAYAGGDYRDGSRTGFYGAVDACTSELERGERRIGSVDSVRRMGERYSVEGQLDDGRGYACSIDDDGRIRSVAVDGHGLI